MARAATTTDAFNAVAEPQRRRILDLLTGGERSVANSSSGWASPSRRCQSTFGSPLAGTKRDILILV